MTTTLDMSKRARDAEHADLHLHFAHYWHAGSGTGSGYHLDALCLRDGDGLPMMPGRQLKGVLRHALRRAEAWGWLSELALPDGPADCHETLLFGSRSQSEHRSETLPGMLRVGNAHLPEAERAWLAVAEREPLRAELFGELFSTAINEHGSAQRYSLRGLEVSLPVTLHTTLSLALCAPHNAHRQQQQAYLTANTGWAALRAALPLVDALGAHRSRGLGEVRLDLMPAGQGV